MGSRQPGRGRVRETFVNNSDEGALHCPSGLDTANILKRVAVPAFIAERMCTKGVSGVMRSFKNAFVLAYVKK